jgi:hypothetical protein
MILLPPGRDALPVEQVMLFEGTTGPEAEGATRKRLGVREIALESRAQFRGVEDNAVVLAIERDTEPRQTRPHERCRRTLVVASLVDGMAGPLARHLARAEDGADDAEILDPLVEQCAVKLIQKHWRESRATRADHIGVPRMRNSLAWYTGASAPRSALNCSSEANFSGRSGDA